MRWVALGGLVIARAAAADLAVAKPPPPASDLPRSLIARAIALEYGEGVPKDQIGASVLYCEAARDGDLEAQVRLGWMYAYGRGVLRDDTVAASLFALAEGAGNVEAQRAHRLVAADKVRLPDCMQPAEPEAVPDEPPVAQSPDPFADLPPRKQKIADMVTELALAYAVSPRLALAVIAVESNFEPAARSVKGARGLMQLVPGTAVRFKVKNAFDARDNVRGGLAYLRWLLSYYQGQVALAAAAYNAGQAVVDRYQGIPPYPETRDYVRRILELFGNDSHPYDPKLAQPTLFLARPQAGLM